MSAILQTSEGETILTCVSVNNEWKRETSNIANNNVNALNFEKRKENYFLIYFTSFFSYTTILRSQNLLK